MRSIRLPLAILMLSGCGASPAPANQLTSPAAAELVRVVHVSARATRTCAVMSSGEVFCWGGGIGSRPERVGELVDAVEVAVGFRHACARTSDGELFCWGENEASQLGDLGYERQDSPVRARIDGVTQVVAGEEFTCALREGGEVWCWGREAVAARTRPSLHGSALGADDCPDEPEEEYLTEEEARVAYEEDLAVARGEREPPPRPVPGEVSPERPGPICGPADFLEIFAGRGEVCGRRRDGSVACWGRLSHDPTGDSYIGRVAVIESLRGAASIALGPFLNGAVTRDGVLSLWGDTRAVPSVEAAGRLPTARTIAIGSTFVCATTTEGVLCWGNGTRGQLGDGTTDESAEPRLVRGLGPVSQLVAGSEHACALDETGALSCWGSLEHGQLGDGRSTSSPGLQQVAGLEDVVDLAVGPGQSCAVREDGSVWCWGQARWGLLGGGRTEDARTPERVPGLEDVRAIIHGQAAFCVRGQEGAWLCWGRGNQGRLGPDEERNNPLPRSLPSVDGATDVGVGAEHACALFDDGTVRCWGNNDRGQIGDDSEEERASPTSVVGIDDARQLSVGNSHTCVLRAGGTVACWGRNLHGQLGDGTQDDRNRPTTVPGLSDIVQIAASTERTCATRASGVVTCWGMDDYGEVTGEGRRASERAPGPRDVAGLSDAVAVVGGEHSTCAVRRSGLDCWGLYFGARQSLSDTEDVVSGGLGNGFVCVLRRDGRVLCAGRNDRGQLGDGAALMSAVPVNVPIGEEPRRALTAQP